MFADDVKNVIKSFMLAFSSKKHEFFSTKNIHVFVDRFLYENRVRWFSMIQFLLIVF